MIAGKQFFGPHPFTPGMGKWEVFAGPPGLLLLQPPLHSPFFPGAGLFHPVSRQQSGAPGGTSFPEEPAGGEQGGEGEGRGGGAKTRLAATATASASELAGRLDPELLNSSQSPGSRRVAPCAPRRRWGAGTPGCCMVGGR